MKIVTALLLLVCVAHAEPCTVAWDAQPAGISYRVFVNGTFNTTVATNQATLELSTDALSTVEVQAFDSLLSSPLSAIVVQPIATEHSINLESWKPGPTFFVEFAPTFFVRAKYILPSP